MKAVMLLIAFSCVLFATHITRVTSDPHNEELPTLFGEDKAGSESCEGTELHQAVRMRNPALVTKLVKGGADLYALDCKQRSPMHLAVQFTDGEMIMALVRNRFDVNRRFGDGNTVLIYTSVNGTLEAMEQLHGVGALLDVVNLRGNTALFEAALSSRSDAVHLLVKLGANVNKKLPGGNNYLHHAAIMDDFDLVKLFTELGTNVDSKNDDEDSALSIAVKNNNPALINYLTLKRKLFQSDAEKNSLLQIAVRGGLVESVYALVEHGASVEGGDYRGHNVLYQAVELDDIAMASVLAELGADLRQMYGNKTLLHVAAGAGSTRATRWLIERGLNMNALGGDNWTPLHFAANIGRLGVVKLLGELGADMNIRTRAGHTPLHLAVASGRLPVVKLLVELGADINSRTSDGRTPLGMTTGRPHTEMAEYLKSKGGVQ